MDVCASLTCYSQDFLTNALFRISPSLLELFSSESGCLVCSDLKVLIKTHYWRRFSKFLREWLGLSRHSQSISHLRHYIFVPQLLWKGGEHMPHFETKRRSSSYWGRVMEILEMTLSLEWDCEYWDIKNMSQILPNADLSLSDQMDICIYIKLIT